MSGGGAYVCVGCTCVCVEGGGACVVDTCTVLFSSVAHYQYSSLQLASVSLADDDLEESPTSLVFFDLKTGSKVILQSPTADVKTTWWKKMSHLVKAISTTTKTASLARTGEDLHLLDLYFVVPCYYLFLVFLVLCSIRLHSVVPQTQLQLQHATILASP